MKKKILFLFAMFLFALHFCGFSQTVATEVTLSGSGSDADGSIVAYQWKQLSGPGTPVIVAPSSAVTKVTGYEVPGIYTYEFTVTDNKGAIGKATVQVTVLAAANIPPVANAGGNLTIQLPQKTAK